MDVSVIGLIIVVWVLLTVVGFYVLSFWFDDHLFGLGWEWVAVMGVAYMVVCIVVDLALSGLLATEHDGWLGAIHVLLMLVVGINYQGIQRFVKYPRRVR